MARYEVTDFNNWSAGVTTTADATLQVILGEVLVTVEASPADADGLWLKAEPGMMQAIIVPSGATVKWKATRNGRAVIALEDGLG